MSKKRLIDLYGLDKNTTDVYRVTNFIAEKRSDKVIEKAKQDINKSNKEVYLANLR